MKKLFQKIDGGWIFLIIAIVICIIASLFNIIDIKSVLVNFLELLQKIIPVLIGVFFLMFLFNLFINPKWIIKYLSSGSGFKGWILTVGAGVVSMGATYFWYPLLGNLKTEGMSNALIAVFLYNHAIKIQLFPFLIHYFGLSFSVIVTIYMLIFSVASGWLVEKLIPSLKR